MSETVKISKASLGLLLGDAQRLAAIRQFFGELFVESVDRDRVRDMAQDLGEPAGIDWQGIDRGNAIKEAKRVLGLQ